jgi:hypothetical protein
MQAFDQIVNLDDPREKLNAVNNLRSRKGVVKMTIKAHRKGRSSNANRYYWGVVLNEFVEFRQGQGEDFTADMAHEFFKLKFLRKPVVNLDTGEVLGQTTRSTADLDTAEFAEYIDKVCAWLAGYDIAVPEANQYLRKTA